MYGTEMEVSSVEELSMTAEFMDLKWVVLNVLCVKYV